MYYALIIVSVIMFGGCFALNDVYRKLRGSNIKISLQFSFVSSIAASIVLLAINRFNFEFTWFTLLMSLFRAIISVGFTFCGFKALGIINLSLYSLFSMLGGMVIPFVYGIIFDGEPITLAKIVALIIISIALMLTVERGSKKKGRIFYLGIFVLNGMSGVIAQIFSSDAISAAKTSAAGFSILSAVTTFALSGLILLFFINRGEKKKQSILSIGVSAVGGSMNSIANWLLVLALAGGVEGSVQYPMVTGGVMIVSTLVCLFGPQKPSKKEIISVILAFVGTLALFLIPEIIEMSDKLSFLGFNLYL